MGRMSSGRVINDGKSMTYQWVGLGEGWDGSVHLEVTREGLSEQRPEYWEGTFYHEQRQHPWVGMLLACWGLGPSG